MSSDDEEPTLESLAREKRVIMRNVMRGRTAIENAFKENPSEEVAHKIGAKLDSLKDEILHLKRCSNRIYDLTDFAGQTPAQVAAAENAIFDEYENVYDFHSTSKGKLSAMFARLNRSSDSVQGPAPRRSLNASFINEGSVGGPFVKMPDMKPPTFDGNFNNFTEWHALFEAMIDSNENLKPIHKLYYLKQAMVGEAKNLLKDFQLKEGVYDLAFKFIKDRYFNKRVIISNHFRDLLDLPTITMSTLRESLDKLNAIVRGLKVCSIDTDKMSPIIAFIVVRKLPNQIRTDWENSHSDYSTYPSFEAIAMFLQSRCFAYESLQSDVNNKDKHTDSKKNVKEKDKDSKKSLVTSKSDYNARKSSTFTPRCLLCNQTTHFLSSCSEFLGKPVSDRYTFVKDNKLCINCLRPGHAVSNCHSSKCRKCEKPHNTLLHREIVSSTEKPVLSGDGKSDSSEKKTVALTLDSTNQKVILLPSAVVMVEVRSKFVKARLVLDNCSQIETVTESFKKRFNLPTRPLLTRIAGATPGDAESYCSIPLKIKSRYGDYTINFEASVVGRIPYHVTPNMIKTVKSIDPKMCLAECDIGHSDIDILIGGKFAHQILSGHKKFVNGLCFEETPFGWVAQGEFDLSRQLPPQCCNLTVNVVDEMKQFFEVEEVAPPKPILSEYEKIEVHFKSTCYRFPDGKFGIRLPREQPIELLADTYRQARAALIRFETSLDVETRSMYINFMKEYRELEHMRLAVDFKAKRYFIPHLFVLRPDSSTTAFRAVFNASASNATGISLNEALMKGPVLQPDLFDTLLNFRTYKIAFSADISKMYRQINVHPDDYPLQSILWRDDPSEAIQIYELTTLTYGTSPASFIATRCLLELADDVKSSHPDVAHAISSEFYMDDLLTGADSIEAAVEKQKLIHNTLANAHFPLRKYISNSSEFLKSLDSTLVESLKPVTFASSGAAKILGLQWAPNLDSFFLNVQLINISDVTLTKRCVSSLAAKIFDPLGFAAPVVIRAKILLQDLWRDKKDWDDPISPEIAQNFRNYYEELTNLPKFEVPRFYFVNNSKEFELLGFCDASTRAYGAAVYIRIVDKSQSHVKSLLVCSKSKVAPIKELTVPRLELLGAVLLAKLLAKVCKILKFDICKTKAYCDSTIALAWLRGPGSKYQTFVRNRVDYVNSIIPFNQWNYVKTAENPADLLTRGISVNSLVGNKFWIHGPKWLSNQELDCDNVELPTDVPEIRVCHVLTSETVFDESIIARFSDLDKAIRIVTIWWKYLVKVLPKLKKYDSLTDYEIGLFILCHVSQVVAFNREIETLQADKPLPEKSTLAALNPFLDKYGLLRVGGRLDNSKFDYNIRHPIILPRRSILTPLLIRNIHEKYFHATRSFTIGFLKSKYWIHGGASRAVKKVVNCCVWCTRMAGEHATQLMGDLPADRVTISRPFAVTGVDFAGPFTIRCTNHRTMKYLKYYAAFFVCFTTCAVHLEHVADLSTSAFIAAFQRFSARRGIPNTVWSDNATNFVGTKNDFEKHCNSLGIQWKFIPARSPHHGGLWESAVKAGKKYLVAAGKGAVLNQEQFITLLTVIEAILNSRPLYSRQRGADSEDLSVLTPGHFLVGSHLMHPPEPETSASTLIDRLGTYKAIIASFWRLWKSGYLAQLQTRSKWKSSKSNIAVGDVVLMKEESPPLEWRMGRVQSIFPDPKGHVRVAVVKANNSSYSRSVNRIVKLPTEGEL